MRASTRKDSTKKHIPMRGDSDNKCNTGNEGGGNSNETREVKLKTKH